MGRALLWAILAGCGFSPAPVSASGGDDTPAADANRVTGDAQNDAPRDAPGTWTVIDTVTIQTINVTPFPSHVTLASGMQYKLRVSGTFSCTFGGTPADAEYYDFTAMSDFTGTIDFGLGIDDSTVDGTKPPHWGTYTTSHVYESMYTGHGAKLQAMLYDSQYDNNSGTLTLEILQLL